MKNSPKIVFTVICVFFLFGSTSLQNSVFSEEVLAESHAATWLRQQALAYLEQLPNENGEQAKQVLAEADRLEVKRSFLVYKKKGLLAHAVADIEYRALVQVADGRYTYEFSQFKVYRYARNRYGKYTRASSRGKSLHKVSKELNPWVNRAIQDHVNEYIEGLKATMN